MGVLSDRYRNWSNFNIGLSRDSNDVCQMSFSLAFMLCCFGSFSSRLLFHMVGQVDLPMGSPVALFCLLLDIQLDYFSQPHLQL